MCGFWQGGSEEVNFLVQSENVLLALAQVLDLVRALVCVCRFSTFGSFFQPPRFFSLAGSGGQLVKAGCKQDVRCKMQGDEVRSTVRSIQKMVVTALQTCEVRLSK
jgi:hypothetical protein